MENMRENIKLEGKNPSNMSLKKTQEIERKKLSKNIIFQNRKIMNLQIERPTECPMGGGKGSTLKYIMKGENPRDKEKV